MEVTDVTSPPGPTILLLRWAGALEQASEHPGRHGHREPSGEDLGPLPEVLSFSAHPGPGAEGTSKAIALWSVG